MTFIFALLFISSFRINNLYECYGNNLRGEPYRVLLEVTPAADGDGYWLFWKGTSQIGHGVRRFNTLVVHFREGESGPVGTVFYSITKVGLDGLWSIGKSKVFKETCGPPNPTNS